MTFVTQSVQEENTRGCMGCYPDNEPDPSRTLTKVVLGYGSLLLCHECLPRMHAATEQARPSCVACGDWDETVSQVPITKASQAMLCASCAASDEVVRTLAAEDGLDEVDE